MPEEYETTYMGRKLRSVAWAELKEFSMSSRPPRSLRKLCCSHFDLFGVQNTCHRDNTLRIERDVGFND